VERHTRARRRYPSSASPTGRMITGARGARTRGDVAFDVVFAPSARYGLTYVSSLYFERSARGASVNNTRTSHPVTRAARARYHSPSEARRGRWLRRARVSLRVSKYYLLKFDRDKYREMCRVTCCEQLANN